MKKQIKKPRDAPENSKLIIDGAKKPKERLRKKGKSAKSKKALQFSYEETEESIKGEAAIDKLNRMDGAGVNFRHDAKKKRRRKYRKKADAKSVNKKRLYSTQKTVTSGVKLTGNVTSRALRNQYGDSSENEEETGGGRLQKGRRRTRPKNRTRSYRAKKLEESLSKEAQKESGRKQRKFIQKQRIKREFAKAKRAEQTTGTAVKGTIDYIKKIGGKVTNFFKENSRACIGLALFLALMLFIMSCASSCSAMFMQNVVTYAGTSYLSPDEDIRQAELYYTQLEAELQQKINSMESDNPDYDEYRYNIGEIGHDPFILISYLSAKYEEFTFDMVKDELDTLFALQYQLDTEESTETETETDTVKVGESLGEVVTSGYCACSICCGIWSGGATASGNYPTANHTLAVDATNPFVPIGTKVVMNGIEYTVEDTGNFARYGVQFDVFYDSHEAALAHGHQTWECYIADDNGTEDVEVTRTTEKEIFNVTLTSNSLSVICQDRLGIFKKELFSAYNETKGNLQMFGSPVDYNWYGSVKSYYGYNVEASSGTTVMNNCIDLTTPSGTEILAGLKGTVVESGNSTGYGNYVTIKNTGGYKLLYANLNSRSVSVGDTVEIGDKIGVSGNYVHVELYKNDVQMNPIFYLETGEGSVFGTNEYTSEAAAKLLEEAAKYLGTPYVWGGYSPSGFDCSGFVSYSLTNSGVKNTGRMNAQGLYDMCTPVSESEVQPGDLVFFTGTYNAGVPVTHVGIYVGNGQMIHCGHPVQYSSIYTSYWQSHFYAFGRW
jgi:cell wall-associated NlpC family hydrolase/3D (Asp-Asp-Asp) domain-containing protein